MNKDDILRINHDELLECAEEAARKGGRHALDQCHRRGEIVRSSAHDLKLQLDHECQAVVEDVIRTRFPSHPIFGEESGGEQNLDAPLLWMIDPIDGTVNYAHGLPLWCCSVAVMSDGRTLAGAVYAPVLDECYTAGPGRKSCCNGEPIGVSNTARLEHAFISTYVDGRSRDLSESMKIFENLNERIHQTRMMGSTAIDLCNVACGRLDGYHESGIYIWDVAAASLIVEQAGGRCEVLSRGEGPLMSFMGTNARIHDDFRRIIAPELSPESS